MREIKFRAWIPSNKSMMTAGSIDFWFQVIAETKVNPLRAKPDSILMQYIGLKDRNGKEIYEGDIVKYIEQDWVDTNDKNSQIQFWEVRIRDLEDGVILVNDSKEIASIYHAQGAFSLTECEVVGNIYDNSELLK